MSPPLLPDFEDVVAAADRLAGHALRTPVLRSAAMDAWVGAELHFKCENLQRTGAFKFRGAFNALARLDAGQRRRGAVAFSGGNHAQGIALAGRMLDIPVTVVMPRDAAASKMEATRACGARIVLYDRHADDREAIARRLSESDGLTLVPPYDHADVIAGQGTATLELLQETGPLDALLLPQGGGGLLAGAILAAGRLAPQCQVYGSEPEAGDHGRQSLRRGAVVHIAPPETIADGARAQHLGALTFALIRDGAAGIVAVPDRALIEAMRMFAQAMKLVVEPTACLGLAAARHGGLPLRGKRVGVVVTGGNVDLPRYLALLGAADSDGMDADLLATRSS
ncbi:threo-3-hydroxy-L-aspartate ammonia-lyase [Achromobacter xylosoxidans]|uniref:threo-3-hydroxy-L-aspartate ammonia-lyase n=1 Tax=Alcaligenes xylosoxydans xylosoxydans TaxID=85698 RepID=UPI000D718A99|nr:threo-3-hydroxy-L-aspartate ammonia-lyase [Achromobacter xylosoxidans]PWV43529.1 threo-3-hydroxy-L-aspartate ammonia-lyase [Achromobacter xylosoxidans]